MAKKTAKKAAAKKRPAKKKAPVKGRGSRGKSQAPAKKPSRKKRSPARKKKPAAAQSAAQPPALDSRPSTIDPGTTLDSPPKWLSSEAAEHWTIVVEQLRQRDRLELVTPQHVAIYCQTLTRYLDAMDKVESEGFTTLTERGEFVSPAAQIALKLIDHLRHLAKDLGLNEPIIGQKNALQELMDAIAARQPGSPAAPPAGN